MTQIAQQLLELITAELGLAGDNVDEYRPKPNHYYVAFSGGVDSTVLLHLMVHLQSLYGFELTALHANHNINPRSAEWAEHCQRVCDGLDVSFLMTSLTLPSNSEVAARDARYEWFRQEMNANSVLLTGHHRQDRVETLLFNLMRGSGSTGLSSMRSVRPFHGSTLRRPLVHISRDDLIQYANKHQLKWVEDPSNQNNDYSRNHIRNVIIPALSEFRTDAVQNIARSAWNLEQENSLLREVAISDLVEVREHSLHPLDQSYALCFEDIVHLSLNRQANLVRFWLRSLQLHIPSQRLLMQLLEAFITPPASSAVYQESGFQFRFYHGFMYAMPALKEAEPLLCIDWDDLDQPINLIDQKIRIDSTLKLRDLCNSNRKSRLKLVSRNDLNNPKALQGHSLNLKKWLQDIGVPPWRRTSLPLLTMAKSDSDVVLGPIDQQMGSDWVSLERPIN